MSGKVEISSKSREPVIVRRYPGGMEEVEQTLCGMGDLADPRNMGHVFVDSFVGKEECLNCGLEVDKEEEEDTEEK